MENHEPSATPSDRPTLIGAFVLGVAVPVLVVAVCRARWTVLLLGGVAWLIAVAVKIGTTMLARRAGGADHRLLWATAYGALSVVTELGIAGYCFLRFQPLDPADVLAFGVGASSAEILLVVAPAVVLRSWRPDPTQLAQWQRSARHSRWVRYAALIERTAALLNHVGARALVYAAFLEGPYILALPAALGFGGVDGIAAYGRLAGWNWFAPVVLRRYYTFALVAGAFNTALYVLLAGP